MSSKHPDWLLSLRFISEKFLILFLYFCCCHYYLTSKVQIWTSFLVRHSSLRRVHFRIQKIVTNYFELKLVFLKNVKLLSWKKFHNCSLLLIYLYYIIFCYCSVAQLYLTLCDHLTAAYQGSLSFTISQSLLKLMFTE